MQKINEFKVGERVFAHALIRSITKGQTTQNKPYLDITLSDKTASISGKLWDITLDAEKLEAFEIAYVTGTVTEWQGQPQLKIEHIEKLKDAPNPSQFVETAPVTGERMANIVEEYIDRMGNDEIREIVAHVYEEYRDRFLEAPAARSMHHAVHAGLAYHTITMLHSAEKLTEVYPFLNRDLLYAGVILHDMAKVEEMDYALGAVKDYTRPGYLLGHIVQGTLIIERAASILGTSERTKEILQHLVVSHHDKGEWGSPQPPRTPEAIMLHFIDNIDAKMYAVKELIDTKSEGEYTGVHKSLRQKLVIF